MSLDLAEHSPQTQACAHDSQGSAVTAGSGPGGNWVDWDIADSELEQGRSASGFMSGIQIVPLQPGHCDLMGKIGRHESSSSP